MKVGGRSGVRQYILLDPGESTEQVLKAIARASFEIADTEDTERNRPLLAELGITPRERQTSWDENRMIPKLYRFDPHAPVGEDLLIMDYVETVRCKTAVHRGRKYLHFYAGDGREKEADMILDLANYYLDQSARVKPNKTKALTSLT